MAQLRLDRFERLDGLGLNVVNRPMCRFALRMIPAISALKTFKTFVSGLVIALVVTLGVSATPSAHAGLFDDEEARKAVIELRTRLAQVEEASKARHAQQEAAERTRQEQMQQQLLTSNNQLSEQLATMRRSMVELNNQLEALRAELAKLRGTDEQLTRDVADLQRRQRDVGQTLDDRLRRLEPVRATVDGRDVMVDPEEKRGFEEAVGVIRGGDFDKASASLAAFMRRYPASPYQHQARFWQGNALYGKRDYKEAISAFRSFVAAAPDHARAPEALLAVANSQVEMKDSKAARKTLDDLIKAYPKSEAAVAAKERLSSLR